MSAEAAEALTDEEIQQLIFRTGFSTSPVITRVSGRGLGMSIVRERIESIGGTVRLDSRPGEGTAVTMVVPSSIATFRGLMVHAGGQRFLIASDAIEQTLRITPQEIHILERRATIAHGGAVVNVLHLRDVLDLQDIRGEPDTPFKLPCVVVRADARRVALLVEEIEGIYEAVVKELPPPLVRVRNVAATGLLGNGEVVMILRAVDLVNYERGHWQPPPGSVTSPAHRPLILVVDDSITTRTVEKNILEMGGFDVRVAADGIEAWEMLMDQHYDLVVSDVDMPRMNGFELTERIRAHADIKALPIILVTALESREEKELGIRLGANAYLFKSGFADSNWLEIVRRMVAPQRGGSR
jgi:two-component system chemotaxis sensor kinase CheA